jgi:hypothetical protein
MVRPVISLTASGDTSGAKDAAALNAAIAALPASGGTIRLGPGAFYFSSTVVLTAPTTSIQIIGEGGRSSGNQPATRLVYLSSTAPFISAQSSNGFRLADCAIQYTNASFAGALIDLSRSTTPSAFASIERCTITGTLSTAVGATALIALTNAFSVQIRDCLFNYAVCAIRGRSVIGDFSNRILIQACDFGQTSQAPIQSAGQAWKIDSCTFEPLSNSNAGAFSQPVGSANGLTFSGCWMGDANTSGTWIDFAGAGAGLVVEGCYITCGSKGIALAASTFGAQITGNHFEGGGGGALATGIDVASSCQGIVVLGNNFRPSGTTIVTNPITLVDDPVGSLLQRVSNDNTTPMTFSPGKLLGHDWFQLQEIAAPGAPAPNNGRLYVEDNGSGKSRLMIRFPTGATQQIAIEP